MILAQIEKFKNILQLDITFESQGTQPIPL